ncbi:hypothetical protein pdam_00024193, partial [Pocillopora damicornis]
MKSLLGNASQVRSQLTQYKISRIRDVNNPPALWKDADFSTKNSPFSELRASTFLLKFLSPESRKTIFRAFVTSHLDYCDSLRFASQVPDRSYPEGFQGLITFRQPYRIFTEKNICSHAPFLVITNIPGLLKIPKTNFKTF